MANKDEQQPTEFEVTLAKAHTHAGVQYMQGEKIIVNKVELEWLKSNHVIA